METTYDPEVQDNIRKELDRRTVEEGMAIWRKRQEELLGHKHREQQQELRQMQSSYSPWNKPGAGAPCNASLRRKNVILEPLNLNTKNSYNNKGWTTESLINRLRTKKMDPLAIVDPNKFFNETSTSAISKKPSSCNEQIEMYKLNGGVELVPLLITQHNYQRPTQYFSTDVTRPNCTINSLQNINVGDDGEHMAALTKQIPRKQEQLMVDNQIEYESCQRHFETFRKFWGRPGHGAPIDHIYRHDLHDILYRATIF